MPQTYPFKTLPGPKRRPIAGLALSALVALPYVAYFLAFYEYWWRGITNLERMAQDPSEFWIFFGLLAGLLLISPLTWKLLNVGRRMRRLDALTLLERDPRAPVLFLRAFTDDDLPDTAIIGMTRTIEQRLAKVLEPIGPIICIGRPGERHPELGAARFYVPDEAWQKAVEYFMRRAAAVVIMVSMSRGVLWEVDQALKKVEPQRLLLCFPYVLPKARRAWWLPYVRMIKNFRYSKKILVRMTEERQERYQNFREFATAQTALEFPASLGNAVFIDFLADRTPRLLLSLPYVLMVNRDPDELNVQPDYKRTVRPFLEKRLGLKIVPPFPERFLTDRKALKHALCGLVLLYGTFVLTPLGNWAAIKFLSVPLFLGLGIFLALAMRTLDKQSSSLPTYTGADGQKSGH